MKVFSLPDEVAFAEPDYAKYDSAKEEQRQTAHSAALKAWLVKRYSGKRTGEILRIQHADGYALYMLADGKGACLIHLPYGDGWDSPLASGLTKKAVGELIDRDKKLAELFAKKA